MCSPWYNEKEKGMASQKKKKKLSHENKRRLIEPPSNHWRQVRGRRASNRTIRITTHYFSFSINSSGFLILIIRKKNKLKEHSQLSKQHKNALSYTLHTFLCRNNKNTIIIVRAASRLYYDKENSQLKFRYDQFHHTLSLHDGFRRA